MTITECKIFPINGEGSTKAIVSITIDECFVVTGIKIMEGRNGLFVSMPSRKTKDGDYKDICFPITKDTRESIQEIVLGEYRGAEPEFVEPEDDDELLPF